MTLLAPKDVASRLGLSTSRVIQLDREGALTALRDSSNRRLYDPATVETFARAREARREFERIPGAAIAVSQNG